LTGSRLFGFACSAGLALILALTASCGRSSGPGKVLETPFPVTDQLGNSREYRLFMPDRTKTSVPLLIYFHGVISPGFKNIPGLKDYTGSPIEETGLIPFCEARRIALLVPKALYEYTFLKQPSRGWLTENEMDGIETIIDTVLEHFPIDRSRVYLAGISAGAVFSHFLANHRPFFYNAIVSHSQAYVSRQNVVLTPAVKGPQFGIVFCYNIGDYKQLIGFCVESERIYREAGYRTVLLPDLPPWGHAWSGTNNARFWKLLQKLGRKEGSTR
jgi:hypothetical protein